MTDTAALKTAFSLAPIVPVLTIPEGADAGALANAFVRAGIRAVEITLRTEAALEAIAQMKAAQPALIVGSGTILNAVDLDAAIEAGAQFHVSPGLTPGLLSAVRNTGALLIPGVATPSEAMMCADAGLDFLKLFPASIVGGIDMLKALGGPLEHLSFMPTGGVNEGNLGAYLNLSNVIAVGGTWLARAADIEARDWAAIEERSRKALALAI